jgi:hypothetical protein
MPLPSDPRHAPPDDDYQPPSAESIQRAAVANAREAWGHVHANAQNGAKEGLRAAIDVYGLEPFIAYDRLCDHVHPTTMRQYLHELLAERGGR